MKNKVSIWLGKFETEQQLQQYLEATYLEDQDFPVSAFATDFQLPHYDSDFSEAYCSDTVPANRAALIESISYSECFIDKIPNQSDDNNAVIALYDFEYNKQVSSAGNVVFVGTFMYENDY